MIDLIFSNSLLDELRRIRGRFFNVIGYYWPAEFRVHPDAKMTVFGIPVVFDTTLEPGEIRLVSYIDGYSRVLTVSNKADPVEALIAPEVRPSPHYNHEDKDCPICNPNL